MNNKRAVRAGEIYDTPEGWCVDTASLSKWINIKLTPDLSNALLVLSAIRKLPFKLAAERREPAAKVRPDKGFNFAELPQASQPYKFWQTPSLDAVVIVGGLCDARFGGQIDVWYELFASGEIGKALFEARLASGLKRVLGGVPHRVARRAFSPARAT